MKATLFVSALAAFFVLELTLVHRSYAESFTFSTAAGSVGQAPMLPFAGDGTNSGARFKIPTALATFQNTNVFIADSHALRRMTRVGTNWVVTTLAGDVHVHGATEGLNNLARFDNPQGIAVDVAGVVYVADTLNNAIRKVTAVGTNWAVITIAGLAGRLNTGIADGSNTLARFNRPYGIAVNNSGTLFVADTVNHTIRRVAPTGVDWVVTTIAGSATNSGTADGTNANARFNSPVGVTVDNTGNFYVTDFDNNTIRKGTPVGTNWVITTIAGLGLVPGSADGSNSNARFFEPEGITFVNGHLYVSDGGNSTIRKLSPLGTNWIVKTLAGKAGVIGSADGTGSAARFNFPYGLAFTLDGTMFVADSLNNTIRSGQLAILLEGMLSGNKYVLSWPTGATAYAVQARASLTPGPWTPQTNGVVMVGDTHYLTNTPGPGSFFYRLFK